MNSPRISALRAAVTPLWRFPTKSEGVLSVDLDYGTYWPVGFLKQVDAQETLDFRGKTSQMSKHCTQGRDLWWYLLSISRINYRLIVRLVRLVVDTARLAV